jgi:hypothetical protein
VRKEAPVAPSTNDAAEDLMQPPQEPEPLDEPSPDEDPKT